MTLKKKFSSETPIVVGGGDQSGMFLPGYRYLLGETIYTVIKSFVADNTEMRRVKRDDGGVEDITVATIVNDHQYSGPKGVTVLDPEKTPKPADS